MRTGERIYAALLHAYPRAFRRRHQAEMMAWFRDADASRNRGLLGGVMFWVRLLLDLTRTAPMEHVRALTDRGSSAKPQAKPEVRPRGGSVGAQWIRDTRIALRSFARRPTFLVLAAGTIAAGVGAVTTIYSVVDAVLLTPLPYPDAHRIMRVGQISEDRTRVFAMSYLDFKDLQDASTSFESLAASRTTRVTLLGDGTPEAIPAAWASPEFFTAMGAGTHMGRTYTLEEDQLEEPVVVLSHSLWEARFGADSEIVGATVVLNDDPYTVVGVLEEGFRPPGGLDSSTPDSGCLCRG